MTSQEIEVYEDPHVPATLIPSESPAEFMEHAGKVAAALVDLVDKEKMFTKVGQGKHLHVDAWTSLGSLLGSVGGKSVYAVPDGDPEPVEIDGVKGFRARMKAVTIDGQVVGGAYGFCMRDEPSWKNKPTYALAGMAETRATSRALRKPLGFIVRLAGYAATGAEEMPRSGNQRAEVVEDAVIVDPEGKPFPDQARVDEPPTAEYVKATKGMWATISELVDAGRNADDIKTELYAFYGVTSTKQLTLGEVKQATSTLKKHLAELKAQAA